MVGALVTVSRNINLGYCVDIMIVGNTILFILQSLLTLNLIQSLAILPLIALQYNPSKVIYH